MEQLVTREQVKELRVGSKLVYVLDVHGRDGKREAKVDVTVVQIVDGNPKVMTTHGEKLHDIDLDKPNVKWFIA